MSALTGIRLLHTIVWLFFVACIVAIPIAGGRRRFRAAVIFSAVVLVECLILAANHGRCPLTDAAARMTPERAANFDIYLPLWLAAWNKVIFGALYVAGMGFAYVRWLTVRRAA